MRTFLGVLSGLPFATLLYRFGLSWAITYMAVVICAWTIFYMVQMNRELQDYRRKVEWLLSR